MAQMEIYAQVKQVKVNRVSGGLDLEYNITLNTEDSQLLKLGLLPAEALLKVIFEVDDAKI